MEYLREQSSSFRKLNTKGCCFLCLESDLSCNEQNGYGEKKMFHMKRLLCHLKIKLDPEQATERDSSSVTFVRNDTKVELCKTCEVNCGRLTLLLKRLEKVQMEINYFLEQTRNRIIKAAKNLDLVQNYSKTMTSDVVTLSQLAFVDRLRKEIVKHSYKMQTGPRPRIKLDQTIVMKLKPGVIVKQENDCTSQLISSASFDDITQTSANFAKSNATTDAIINPDEIPHSIYPNEDLDDDGLDSILAGMDCTISTEIKLAPAAFSSISPEKCPQLSGNLTQVRSQPTDGNTMAVYIKDSATGMFLCSSCKKPFDTIFNVRRHYQSIHLNKRYKCDVCNVATFSFKDSLRRHKKRCNGVPKKKSLKIKVRKHKCDICNVSVFVCPYALAVHKKTCQENIETWMKKKNPVFNFACELCNKRFYSRVKLSEHRRAAHGNRGWITCDICQTKLKGSSNLQRHKDALHFGVTYSCKFCKRIYRSRSKHSIHERSCSQKNDFID